MEMIIILAPFFDDPNRKFCIRELSRILGINHMTVRDKLKRLAEEGYLTETKDRIYSFYQLNTNKKSLNLKLYYNLEKLRESGFVEELENEFDYPVIVLFGSYATATDYPESDIDICLITNVKKKFSTEKYSKKLKRVVSLHFFKNTWKNTNPELVNNIANGIVLSGELEIL